MELRVHDDRLFVDAGAASVWVNGRRHTQSKPLPDTGMLRVGGVTLVFGPQEADLASFQPPKRRSVAFWGGALILVALISLASLLLMSHEPTPEPDLSVRVDALLQQMTLPQVRTQWDQNHILQLSGYSPTDKMLEPVRNRLQSWGVQYRDNVVCADQLERNVQDVLIQAGYLQVCVQSTGKGDVTIRADITMGQRWTAVQPHLAEVPGLTHWQIENPYEEQGEAIITALIQSGLGGAVSMNAIGKSFVISGVLDSDEKQRVTALIADLRTRYPGVKLSYQEVPASNEFSQRLPAPVAGIIHGPRGDYLVLENGVRLSVGSRLPDGSEVVVLTDKAVTFKQGRMLFNYHFEF